MDNYQKYIEDRRFLKWVFDPDAETESYYAAYLETHPEELKEIMNAKKELRLLAVRNEKARPGRKHDIYGEILRAGNSGKSASRYLIRPAAFARYAAVALIFFAIGSLMVYLLERNRPVMTADESMLVKSASLNTMVYLADGAQREVADATATIDFSHRGLLFAGSDSLKTGDVRSATANNLVVVPPGKRARVKLYDGSVVSLNAGSRIVFPVEFTTQSRQVYLVGEAFFDIEENPAVPFFVGTSSSVIKVLGTSFHVCAYPDRPELTAYLEEGEVRFRGTDNSWFSGWIELKPGEQVTLNRTNNTTAVSQGDSRYYELWKEGIVQFDNESVGDLLTRIARYYNITMKLANKFPDGRRIKGKLDLNANRDEVFEYIEKITDGKIIKINAGEFMLEI